jgi:hypothetical protein
MTGQLILPGINTYATHTRLPVPYPHLSRKGGVMKRRVMLLIWIILLAVLGTTTALANPVVQWFLRDSPVGDPNGIWDDQWSGGSVNPPGEIITWVWPPSGDPCGDSELAASIAAVGSGENALLAYTDPVYEGNQAEGTGMAVLSFRQTCWEAATVVVSLFRVEADGSDPLLLASASQVVAVGAWPPTAFSFELTGIPLTPMNGRRFLFVISSEDAQCTDLVWDCDAWACWITLPEEGNPAEPAALGAVKALYR